MFSGIVEALEPVLSQQKSLDLLRIKVKKPIDFNDLSVGQSISINGVCLSIEAFDQESMVFALAAETLHITQWNTQDLTGCQVNLERSLKIGDRLHGHFVTGHVDALAQIVTLEKKEESMIVELKTDLKLAPLIWKKGSVCLNGVSLTVNEACAQSFQVCLIPETLKQTNLKTLQVGDFLNLEVDYFARGYMNWLNTRKGEFELNS